MLDGVLKPCSGATSRNSGSWLDLSHWVLTWKQKPLLWTERSITISLSFFWNEPLSTCSGSKVNNSWPQERKKKGSFRKRTAHFEATCCQVMAWHSYVTDLNSDRAKKGLNGGKRFKKINELRFFFTDSLALMSTRGLQAVTVGFVHCPFIPASLSGWRALCCGSHLGCTIISTFYVFPSTSLNFSPLRHSQGIRLYYMFYSQVLLAPFLDGLSVVLQPCRRVSLQVLE